MGMGTRKCFTRKKKTARCDNDLGHLTWRGATGFMLSFAIYFVDSFSFSMIHSIQSIPFIRKSVPPGSKVPRFHAPVNWRSGRSLN